MPSGQSRSSALRICRDSTVEIEAIAELEGIDSHQHFVDVDRFEYYWMQSLPEGFHRPFTPDLVLPEMSNLGIRCSVVVQAHPSADETWALVELASRFPFIRAIVASIDLSEPDIEETLQKYQSEPLIRGVRHQQAEDGEADWFLHANVMRGLKAVEMSGLVCDVLCRPHQLHALPEIADACPTLRIVLEHAGKPPIRLSQFDGWAKDIEGLSSKRNVCCKLSELVTQADWQTWEVDDLRPYVNHCLAVFGYDRLMWGSGWPVCLLASNYQLTLSSILDALPGPTESELLRLLRTNALDWYGIKP